MYVKLPTLDTIEEKKIAKQLNCLKGLMGIENSKIQESDNN